MEFLQEYGPTLAGFALWVMGELINKSKLKSNSVTDLAANILKWIKEYKK